MVWDLALQQPGAVHLHVCLECLLRGPSLGFISMTGRAAGDRAGLGEEEGEEGREGQRNEACGKGEGPGSALGGGGEVVVVRRWLSDRLGLKVLLMGISLTFA